MCLCTHKRAWQPTSPSILLINVSDSTNSTVLVGTSSSLADESWQNDISLSIFSRTIPGRMSWITYTAAKQKRASYSHVQAGSSCIIDRRQACCVCKKYIIKAELREKRTSDIHHLRPCLTITLWEPWRKFFFFELSSFAGWLILTWPFSRSSSFVLFLALHLLPFSQKQKKSQTKAFIHTSRHRSGDGTTVDFSFCVSTSRRPTGLCSMIPVACLCWRSYFFNDSSKNSTSFRRKRERDRERKKEKRAHMLAFQR